MIEALSVDVQKALDEQRFGRFHARLAGLCALAVLLDGFDAQMVGFVAPVLARQWHIPRAALSPVLSSGLVGMLIGALVFGPLADRLGRKPILIFCTIWFGAFSLLTATAASFRAMVLLRLLTGLGLGGTMPNAIALTAEYMPKRLRATGVMFMFSGFAVGAAAGGFLAAGLITRLGWPSVFILGGALPCLTAGFLLQLPESLRFLALKGGRAATIRETLRRVAPGLALPSEIVFTAGERAEEGFVVKRLFTGGRARMTVLLWVIFFMSLLELFFVNSWLPTVLHDAGLTLGQAIVITAMFQAGGAIGSLLLGRLIDRRASYRVLVWAYLGAGFCVFLIGMAGGSVALEAAAVCAAGFCVIGGQTGANSLAAESYPTGVRSTGSGWALGIGRIGSIAGPVLGGVLLSSQLEMKRVFLFAAVPSLIAAWAAFAVKLPNREEPVI